METITSDCLEQLKKHLKDNDFEMFCHVYNSYAESLAEHHDKLIIAHLGCTNLPLNETIYNPIKKYVNFLVEKEPTSQLICLMIAQKEDTSKYVPLFGSLDHLLFIMAAKAGSNSEILNYINVEDDVLARLILKLDFPEGEFWLYKYKSKNQLLFCISVLSVFLERVYGYESYQKEYNKCIPLLYKNGLDRELTEDVIQEYLNKVEDIKSKVGLIGLNNKIIPQIQAQLKQSTLIKKGNYYVFSNQATSKKTNFYIPLEVQKYLGGNKRLELAQKIYNMIKLSKMLPDKEIELSRNKI